MTLKFIMMNNENIHDYELDLFEANLMFSIGYGSDVRKGYETTGLFTCRLTMFDDCANVMVF